MKKILAILFISSFVHSETNQQSIELTCEVGGNIFYFYFEEDINKSWWKHHKENVSPIGSQRGVWSKKMLNKRNNFVKVTTLNEARIVALLGTKAYVEIVNLNRLNGRVSIGINSGECFKGFKEYNKSEI
tara:strand:- start:506 stop:895 length:390 start_codon:yes stop_codon:yes gene_type:complete